MFDPSVWRERHDEPELLDQGLGTQADVQSNLAEMWRINRYAGGLRALTQHLFPRLQQHHGERITIADLGCGAANLAVYLVKWGRRHNVDLRVVAVDITDRNLFAARNVTRDTADIHLLQADASTLPFPTNKVDYILSSLLLHHLAPSAIVTMLTHCFRLARRAVIMSDIVRGWKPAMAFRLGQPIFAHHYLTRHDGLLSIRRAYKSDEMRALASQAGLVGAQVFEHFPWRMTLVVDK